MLYIFVVFLLLTIWLSQNVKGPLWALAFSWLLCTAPIAIGMITFSYDKDIDFRFASILCSYLLCFIAGYLLQNTLLSPTAKFKTKSTNNKLLLDFVESKQIAFYCWVIGLIGVGCLLVDFFVVGNFQIGELTAIRDSYVNRKASIFGQIASVLTWGCLYSFIFAISYREHLKRKWYLFFLSPVFGFFLISLLSAGRQAAAQIMLFVILIFILEGARANHIPRHDALVKGNALASTRIMITAIASSGMIAYMGYVSLTRDDALFSFGRVEVLEYYFEFDISPIFDTFLTTLGESVRTTIIEGIAYFSGSIGLFSQFLKIEFDNIYYGTMSFPFIFRQIETLTGISVLGTLNYKTDALATIGAIGTGWTTGISSYIMDFGPLGAGFYLFLNGYYSAHTWNRAIRGTGFHEGVIAIIMMLSALYMPFQVGSSDTNILLLWIACVCLDWWQKRGEQRLRLRHSRISN